MEIKSLRVSGKLNLTVFFSEAAPNTTPMPHISGRGTPLAAPTRRELGRLCPGGCEYDMKADW